MYCKMKKSFEQWINELCCELCLNLYFRSVVYNTQCLYALQWQYQLSCGLHDAKIKKPTKGCQIWYTSYDNLLSMTMMAGKCIIVYSIFPSHNKESIFHCCFSCIQLSICKSTAYIQLYTLHIYHVVRKFEKVWKFPLLFAVLLFGFFLSWKCKNRSC